MKALKIILSAIAPVMATTPILFATSCGEVKVTGIKISTPYTTIGFNQEMQCSVKVTPDNATNKNVTWTVSNDLATVSSTGKVKARSTIGTFILKATAKDGSGIYDEVTITIDDVKVTDIALRATPFKVNINSDVYCKATVSPSTASNKELDWTITQGGSYATLDQNGKLSVNGSAPNGTTIVVEAAATDGSGVSQTVNITVDTTADTEEYDDFIHNRSFSLLGYSPKVGYCWGTGWIISDATPDVLTDYKYYIATNWHVVLGHQSVEAESPSTFNMYFGDKTKTSGMSAPDDYTKFTSYSLESESNFYYTSRTNAIDFYVAKADFSSATGDTKSKLDALNDRQKERGAITEFTPTTTDSKQYLSSTMYIGGFPVQNRYYATWETHSFNTSTVGLEYYSKGTESHSIDDYKKYIDTAPQYVMDADQGTSWMIGGASGSMLLGKYDGQYKVAGIYWGGWTNKAGTAFYPSFSIFNSDSKNFIQPYLQF